MTVLVASKSILFTCTEACRSAYRIHFFVEAATNDLLPFEFFL